MTDGAEEGGRAALRAPGVDAIYADQRGAIMVLGIFMCTCMVGALWYLAGIGDAIIYRERLQEGADAAAFSGAVLHARGMNLIVLLNLIMALILAIRVLLKAIYLVLQSTGTVLSAIPYTAALGATLLQAANITNQTVNQLKNPIDQSIKALSQVQTVIARIVPPASVAGSLQVGMRYRPIVELTAAGNPTTVPGGLPVENDSPDHLCEKAGQAVGALFGTIIPIPGFADFLGGAFGKIARAAGSYFCETGGGSGSAPDMGSVMKDVGGQTCDEQKKKMQESVNDAQKRWQEECDAVGCDQGGAVSPEEQAKLDRLAASRDEEQKKIDDFDEDACKEDNQKAAQKESDKVLKEQQQKNQNSSGDGMNPKKMKADWKNGHKDAQIVAVATGDLNSILGAGSTGAKIGAWKTSIDMTPPEHARFGIAQAEFFFDCSGKWKSSDCNGKPEESNAMWRMRWRARLRRYNDPFTGGGNATDILAASGVILEFAKNPADTTMELENALLLKELLAAAQSTNLIIH